MTANKPMTGEQLDELMTVAVNMQRDAETDCNRPSAMFAYAVQAAVLELRKVRNDSVELEQKLADSQREFRAADATIENLQMQVEKLAAENAGLKKANEIALKILNDEETLVTSLWASSVQEVEVKTPATDAFLAEVRAQGVEMMAAEADQLMDEFGDDSYKVMVTADLQRFANAFAAQLRQESAQ